MLVFGAPSRYYQGPGCLEAIGEIAASAGQRFAVVVDAFVLPMLRARLEQAFAGASLAAAILPFSGDVTEAAIADLAARARAGAPDAVIAIGGGKAMDIGKALAHRLGCDVITVPTAAANDAPTSKNYVIYDENHALVAVEHLPASPRAVIVDSGIIAGAPKALLVAGIGDAVTKAFEAAQCHAVQGTNMFGHRPSLSAVVLARAGYETVRRHAEAGLALAGTGQSSPAFEELLEAMFVMGGLGFESGGLSIAHAMTRGLSKVEGAATAAHGHQVAYGLLVQLRLEGRDAAFMDDLTGFYARIGLPATLTALGVPAPDEAVFRQIAGPTLAAPHARNFERTLTEQDLVDAMRDLESLSGRPA